MKVTLSVDGKRIGMNEYVQEVFASVAAALIDTLKGVPGDWDRVTIKVRR